MAYINMTKDFSQVKRTLPGLGLTKRQLLAGIAALAAGIPVFFLCRVKLKMDVTFSAAALCIAALPFAFCILFKKDNLGIEKWAKYFYDARFLRNTERPYMTDNMYELLERQEKLKKEVEAIVFKGKSKKEIRQIREAGISSEITVGRGRNKRKISVPLKGRIDAKTKKELEKAVAKAKLKGAIPESAQDTIPYKRPYEDGIFESDNGYYTMTIAFEDITYQLLDNTPKNILFERWCNLLNYFDPDIHFQFNYANMELNKESYERDFAIPGKSDKFNRVRKEYSDMLLKQLSKGTNNLRKERYLTFGIHATDYKSAKLKLIKICKQLERYLRRLNSRSRVLDGYARLELLFRIFHPGTGDKLLWNFDMPVKTGLSSKDFIAPSSFSFKYAPDLNATKYFRVGDRVGAVNAVKVYASDMEDRIIADILNIDSNVWVSIHADPLDRKKALQLATENLTDIQGMIMREQKDAVKSGYDMDLLPPELQSYKDAGDKLYHDLQRKDEQLFTTTITIVQTAATRKELENNIFELNGILSSYQSRLERLDYRQEQGYMSSLPLGNNTIAVSRIFTTTDMAIFIPFTTKELYNSDGQYYGMNSLSNNVIMVNRKKLVNPNALIFGMPGFGKTFFGKREILDVFLKTDDDGLIIDPEGEYKHLVRMLGGQVIRISLASDIHINPMEIDLNVKNEKDGDYDPVAAKCNFVTSMCELILGNNAVLGKKELAVIDEGLFNRV